MEYIDTVLDRKTGELVTVSAGDWITLTELGDRYSVSRVKVRAVLRKMNFLYVTGGRAHNRHHLMPWVVTQGLGKHVPAKRKGQYPFDVVSPEGQTWIAERWSTTSEEMKAEEGSPSVVEAGLALGDFKDDRGRHDLNIQGSVLWLSDHYPGLKHTEIAGILSVTQQLVSRYLSVRSRQLQGAKLRRAKPLEKVAKVRVALDHPADFMFSLPSGGARSITYIHNTPESVTQREKGHLSVTPFAQPITVV
jgi:hypothetical protein